jgi:hypothetical protein
VIAFACEPIAAIWDEAMTLAKIHHAGTKGFRRHEPLNPSKERYAAYERQGCFLAFTARDGHTLIGYFGIYVTYSMHSQLLMATEDTFFIHPDYRDGFNAIRFIKYVERAMRDRDVHEILFSCEMDNSVANRLLTFLKYEPVIQQYRKLLSPGADSAPSQPMEAADVRTIATART